MRRNALIALAYACAGGLALLLAIPPGFASPLFFPAGIAVATVLRFGPRVLPATFAGSLIINIALGLQDPHRWTSTGALAILMVAIGATFQAWVGARLIARTASDDLALDSGAAITRFMLLGGPLSCLVNASWSTLSLHLFGLVPAEQLLFTWANWWIGDAVGVAIVAPICLTFIGAAQTGVINHVPYVRDVLHDGDVIPSEARGASNEVSQEEGADIANMSESVDRWSAGVQRKAMAIVWHYLNRGPRPRVIQLHDAQP